MISTICDKLPDRQSHEAQKLRTVSLVTAKSAVIVCLMRFSCGFGLLFVWSFSMPSEAVFLGLGYHGYGVYNLVVVDGVENLD